MSQRRKIVLATLSGAALLLYLGNASSLVRQPSAHSSLLAHRGLHQAFSHQGITNETCAAERIDVLSKIVGR